MPQVIIQRGGSFHGDYVFSGSDYLMIGRAQSNDICLPDPARRVSRYHAAIIRAVPEGERYFIRDLGSLRSTRVSGQAVSQHLLREGDVIEIGTYELVYSAREHPKAESSPLRVVPRKAVGEALEQSTARFTSHEVFRDLPLTETQREVVESILQTTRDGMTADDLFAQMMLPVIKAAGARRGFVGLFCSGRDVRYEVIGRRGMRPGDQIEITDPDFLVRLLHGKAILDDHTLLVPILQHETPLGFICLDRVSSADPFSQEDVEFLIMLGHLATARSGSATARSIRRSRGNAIFDWPFDMIGRSEVMQELRREIREAASGDLNVLVLGESGTGKELVARAIHAASAYSSGPFLAKNCAAITESLAETEIFGYARRSGIAGADPEGASGWFEQARGGSLFLDEIQGLTVPLQDKFLRILQDKEVWRVRGRSAIPVKLKIIAATDQDLDHAIEEGSFRKPFYFRFAKIIHLPPLRERKEDIPLLTFYFLDRCARKLESPVRTVSHRALLRLQTHSWSGNVRQLENCIETAMSKVLDREILFSWDFAETIGQVPTTGGHELGAEGDIAARPESHAISPTPPSLRSMAEVEREKIMEALESTAGNISRATKLLGYRSRQTMLNKMDRYDIPRHYGDPDHV